MVQSLCYNWIGIIIERHGNELGGCASTSPSSVSFVVIERSDRTKLFVLSIVTIFRLKRRAPDEL